MVFIKIVLLSASDDIDDVLVFNVNDIIANQINCFIETGACGNDICAVKEFLELDDSSLQEKEKRMRACCIFLQKTQAHIEYNKTYYFPVY